jgi:hypothetical protein
LPPLPFDFLRFVLAARKEESPARLKGTARSDPILRMDRGRYPGYSGRALK